MMQPRARFLNFLEHKEVDRPPVWLMRQAGRYLPEYLETRKKAASFRNLCYNPELACEVALQPLKRYPVDAAIVFADILNVIEACGTEVEFKDQIGPVITNPIRTAADCEQLKPFSHQLDCVLETIQRIRQQSPEHGMIGFVGSPWTMACYAVEGKLSKDLKHIKHLLHHDPSTLKALLDHLTQAASVFAQQQIDAGCDCIVIFDSWGGTLGISEFEPWTLAYQQRIIESLSPHPVFLFTRSSYPHLKSILNTKPAGICIDWTCPLDEILSMCQQKNILLQGNFDPSILCASPEKITHIIQSELSKLSCHKSYLPSLGHGLMPHIQPEKVAHFIQQLQSYSWQLS